jgi:hypothetical protein
VVIAATLLCYGRVVTFGYTAWDDLFNVSHNPRLSPPSVGNLAEYWRRPAFAIYAPLTYTVWSGVAAVAYRAEADVTGSHLPAAAFHATNLVIHLFTTVAVYAVLRLLVGTDWAAGAGALLFSLHPLQAESVAWVAGTKDLLAGLFSTLAILFYVRAARPETVPSQRWTWANYGLATAAFVCAMLSKPSAMVLPAVVLVLDLWSLRTGARRLAMWLTPWFVLAVVCAIVARVAQPGTHAPPLPVESRLLVAGDSLAFYVCKLVAPVRLGIDYGRSPDVVLGAWWGKLTWIIPAVLAVVLWLNRRRWPGVLVGALVFAIGLSPVLGWVSFDFQRLSTVADHYVYFAMLGPALAAAWLLARSRGTRLATVTAAAVLCALAALTFLQLGHWRDGYSLYPHALRVNPSSVPAMNNLANVILLPGSGRSPREALAHTTRAYELMSRTRRFDAGTLDTHGYALVLGGRVGEGIEMLRRSIASAPTPDAYYHLGEALLIQGKPDEAEPVLRAALAAVTWAEAQGLPVGPRLRGSTEQALARAAAAMRTRAQLSTRVGYARIPPNSHSLDRAGHTTNP